MSAPGRRDHLAREAGESLPSGSDPSVESPRSGDRVRASATLTPTLSRKREREIAWAAAATVVDPEIPVLTIADLGVLRDVEVAEDGAVEVSITPTYSGCPAMNVIALEVELALARAGIANARIKTVLSPAWTTDWMSEEGRRKLKEYGIAPPGPKAGRLALFAMEAVACPLCGSEDTEKLAEFGSTACKALWRCRACREPFDAFKCL